MFILKTDKGNTKEYDKPIYLDSIEKAFKEFNEKGETITGITVYQYDLPSLYIVLNVIEEAISGTGDDLAYRTKYGYMTININK